MTSARSRSTPETALAALFFLAATAVMTWPQVAHLSDEMTDLWDAKLSAWVLHWDYAQALRDPMNLFQAPILHPARYALAFSENFWGAAAFGFPLLASGASLLLNYNVVFLLGMFLSAFSAWALARYVTGDPLSSIVAGLIYAFLPWRFSQIAHIHMQWGPFLCLLFLFLLRYLHGGERRDAILFGVFFAYGGITCIHYAVFSGFLIAVTLALEAACGGPERGRRIRGALLAVAVGVLVCLPFAIPYKKASELYGMRRTVGEMEFFSARLADFLSAGSMNRLYGALTRKWWRGEGDFFPGLTPLALAGIAVSRLRRRGPIAGSGAPISPGRRRAARLVDGLILLTGVVWLAVLRTPQLAIGPLRLGDPGRALVFLTALAILRLAVAFPGGSRFQSLADFLRRRRLDRRAVLMLLVASAGILVALGGRTPYYHFLFVSFGTAFRAIRAPARGIVLFHVALSVLAAWGLSLLTRGKSPTRRIIWVAAAVVLIGFEYRAFPLNLYSYDIRPPTVYRWLKNVQPPGAVIEWPLGIPYDAEHTLRQADHQKPLVNGYSSYFPPSYGELWGLMRLRPIPDQIWEAMRELGGSVLVWHPHMAEGADRIGYVRIVRHGIETGRLTLVASFPHGGDRDFVFRLASAPRWESQIAPGAAAGGGIELTQLLEISDAELAPPFGTIHLPEEGQKVAPGFWAHGWALDDSGIAEIRVATELGPAGAALIGGVWPGLAGVFPDYPETKTGGAFGFAIPALPPGPHTLVLTFVGRDGGETTLRRGIEVLNPPLASPTPKGPGS